MSEAATSSDVRKVNLMTEIAEMKAQLRRQKWFIRASLAGWMGGISFLLLGAADMNPIQNLRVKRLALIDANGVERLILDADNTHATLNGRVWQRRSPVSGIILQNARGDEMGGMATDANGQAAIALDSYTNVGPVGATDRIGLISKPDGTAGFLLMDVEGKSRASITSGADLNAEFQISGQDGQPKIKGRVSADGTSTWSEGTR